MTVFATQTDLERLGMSARALSGVDPSVIADALASASSIVESYLPSRYQDGTLTVWPASIIKATCDLAQHILVSGPIGYNPDGSHEEIRLRAEDAHRWLTKLAQGTVTLPTPQTSPSRGPAPSVISRTRDVW